MPPLQTPKASDDPVQRERQRCLAILEAHRQHFKKTRAFARVMNAIRHGDEPETLDRLAEDTRA